MIQPHVRPASIKDTKFIAQHMRESDVMEIRAASGLTPLEALQHSIILSDTTLVGSADRPFCIFGVAPSPNPLAGIVWLLGTDEIIQHRRAFLAQCRDWLDRFHDTYPVLFNFVDERNTVHVHWLKWLGAVFIHRHPEFGKERRPFLEFVHVRRRISRPPGR